MVNQEAMRAHIFLKILERFSHTSEERQEALQEYLLLTLPNISIESATRLAELIPDILPALYKKWIDAFVERLFSTIPLEQLEVLCSGSEEDTAALGLVFLMFMESERMEVQMEADLREYAARHSVDADMGGLVAEYLRKKVAALACPSEGQ